MNRLPPYTVFIGGKFDPIHQGHIEYIVNAAKLGDYLYVAINTDEVVAQYSKKKFCAIPFQYRRILVLGLLKFYDIQGEVLAATNSDGTVTDELRCVHPDIFAKGGDRTPENMPASELALCQELGIKLVYGVSEILNSSSKIWSWTEEAH